MQALAGTDITIYGDGSQTRSFCFVDDLVQGLFALMEQEETVGPVNIGNPNEFTIKQLAEMTIELTGSKSKLIFLPLPGDDPKQRRPDITRAKKHLKWEPNIQLREGLQKTIDYFKALDLRHFKQPTKHTAHQNTDEANQKGMHTHAK
jgi:UDP-glucuronate decarboxylase